MADEAAARPRRGFEPARAKVQQSRVPGSQCGSHRHGMASGVPGKRPTERGAIGSADGFSGHCPVRCRCGWADMLLRASAQQRRHEEGQPGHSPASCYSEGVQNFRAGAGGSLWGAAGADDWGQDHSGQLSCHHSGHNFHSKLGPLAKQSGDFRQAPGTLLCHLSTAADAKAPAAVGGGSAATFSGMHGGAGSGRRLPKPRHGTVLLLYVSRRPGRDGASA
mmetsp:Transcript_36358/g.102712  ORF Transcript_36358/g.102712 Transcript_36358/m.102712 type:complete len:221 (+) Transcript_36358:680-1342(+)